MSISDADVAFAVELFSEMPSLTTRKMMGGLSIYSEGTIFAIVQSDGRIFLKGGRGFGNELEAEGGVKWTYTRDNGKVSSMPYWSLPEAALDDPEVACDWAQRALAHL